MGDLTISELFATRTPRRSVAGYKDARLSVDPCPRCGGRLICLIDTGGSYDDEQFFRHWCLSRECNFSVTKGETWFPRSLTGTTYCRSCPRPFIIPERPSLEQAAKVVASDWRRDLARGISARLRAHTEKTIPSFGGSFDTRYATVVGSTERNTHLAEQRDFDIGLLPLAPRGVYEDAFRNFVEALGARLSADQSLCTELARLYATGEQEVANAFSGQFRLSVRQDREAVVSKVELPGGGLIEILAGRYDWHYAGLRYNEYWRSQMDKLDGALQSAVESQVCLLKLLSSRQGCYGYKGPAKGLSARGIEQLIIRQALAGASAPLLKAMQLINDLPTWAAMRLELPHPQEVLVDIGLSDANLMNAFNDEGWRRWKKLATELLAGSIDYWMVIFGEVVQA